MSASLVGSEMCIRDSCLGRNYDEVVGNPLLDKFMKDLIIQNISNGFRTCLLYTSPSPRD
ncbi:hypothetical protein JMUB7549_27590 [Staphylococcus aureus]